MELCTSFNYMYMHVTFLLKYEPYMFNNTADYHKPHLIEYTLYTFKYLSK